jgi:hypothetical protein
LQVVVNGLTLDLTAAALSGRNVANCEHGCRRRPCGPGTCVPHLDAFSCQCPQGWHGPNCDRTTGGGPVELAGGGADGSAAPLRTPAFTGDSFLFFNNEEIHQK